MARDLPSIEAQRLAINRWLVKYGERRPSEAAMEVTTMGAARRRKLFRSLRDLKCIEHRDDGWWAVAPIPSYERAVVQDE